MIWDAQTGTKIASVKGSTLADLADAYSSSGNLLALGDSQGTVSVVDYGTAEIVLRITGHTNRVSSVVFMHDDKRLASVSDDGTVHVWSARTREPLLVFDIGQQRGEIISSGASGRALFVASRGRSDARMFALSPTLDMTPKARREYICERSLIGAHSFLEREMDDVILRGREELRDPCRQRGPLRPEYYAQVAGRLWARMRLLLPTSKAGGNAP
jgi:hypothetical protein